MSEALEQQAHQLAITNPYSLASIRRLQLGLMSTDPQQPGSALTEEEAIAIVPHLLNLDAALGRNSGVGAAVRMIKQNLSKYC